MADSKSTSPAAKRTGKGDQPRVSVARRRNSTRNPPPQTPPRHAEDLADRFKGMLSRSSNGAVSPGDRVGESTPFRPGSLWDMRQRLSDGRSPSSAGTSRRASSTTTISSLSSTSLLSTSASSSASSISSHIRFPQEQETPSKEPGKKVATNVGAKRGSVRRTSGLPRGYVSSDNDPSAPDSPDESSRHRAL